MTTIYTLFIVAVSATALQSCHKVENTSTDSDAQKRVAALEAQIAQLQHQQSTPAPVVVKSATPTPAVKEDSTDRLKRLLSNFPEKMGEARSRVLTYNITKTDSVVSPLIAVVDLDFMRSGMSDQYKIYLALQNDIWRVKRMEDWVYKTGMTPNLERDPTIEDPNINADWERIETYLK